MSSENYKVDCVNSKPHTISQALVYLSGPYHYSNGGSFNDTGEVSAVTVIPGKLKKML